MKMSQIPKLEKDLDKLKVKCKCGHTVEIYHENRICNVCGRYVFKNKEDEFKYRLNEKILKNN